MTGDTTEHPDISAVHYDYRVIDAPKSPCTAITILGLQWSEIGRIVGQFDAFKTIFMGCTMARAAEACRVTWGWWQNPMVMGCKGEEVSYKPA